jgi:ABC-2 type transport system ATP-binding protein
LVTERLGKSYRVGHIIARRRPALVDLSLRVERGEVFGYLGPNGSGKTTTLKLLTGLLFPDQGTATVLGCALHDPAWRFRAGYLPEQPYFYDYLTAAEYVEYAARLLGLSRAEGRARTRRLLAQVGLGQVADVPLRRFSKGMLQRLGLAQALVGDPEIVFLDEPMSGLDPLGRRLVRDLVLELKGAGKTVFFSTHILSDAEALCDRVALLREGRLLQCGRLDEILQLDVSHLEVLASGGHEEARAAPPPPVRALRPLGERWRFEVDEADLVEALAWLRAGGARVLTVQPVRQSLEDYFFSQLERGREPAPRRGGALWDQA